MIIFKDCFQEPFKYLKKYYDQAKDTEKSIEAIALSTIDANKEKPFSRFVNIKYIERDKLIFFTNYNSNKSFQINTSNKVACIFFWKSINIQIRIEGRISKCSEELSNKHFSQRSKEKNVLAISSNQSQQIESYEKVKDKYKTAFDNYSEYTNRPSYWGGYEITPSYFEFWRGEKNRLNFREEFKLLDSKQNLWSRSYLEP